MASFKQITMALTIATISLCILIVIIQHVYNWLLRKVFAIMEEDGGIIYFLISFLILLITFGLFKLLIDINK